MTTYVAVFGLVLGYLGLVAAYLALRTLARLRRATVVLARGAKSRETMLEATERHIELTSAVAGQLGALRNVALVRYDAFEDVAGRLSFSLALLDDDGDGVALTAITGRSDTRIYAKGISRGTGEHPLSPEEEQAVRAALGRRAQPPKKVASVS